jgi:signal transduction histidine kinase/CheY-like chemotaxis protein
MAKKPTYEELEQRVKELREVVVGYKRDKEALRQSQRELRIRNRIANIFLVVPDDEVYGEVLQVVLEAMKSEYGAFGYIDENEAIVFPSLTRDVWDKCQVPDKDIVFPREVWSGNYWGKSIIGKKTCCSNKPLRVPKGHVPILKMLTVPVVHQGKVIGQMAVANKSTDYDENDKELLERIVDHISPILHARFERDKQEKGRKRAEKEKKKLEGQLRQAQKMEAIGTLAGGIAHEFNNTLCPITGYAYLTMDYVPEGSVAQKNLHEILKAANRAKDLVQQILTFSRQSEHERKFIKIQPIIKEALKLLRSSIPTTIKISQNIDGECGAILADPTQIYQVLMNLCTNAYHAMREKGGVLEVTLLEEEISPDDSESNLDLSPGTYLKLTVSDTGHGMDHAVMEKIFIPYFTTKPFGEGTGMGLAITHGIVKSCGGDIQVYSEPSEGTTFHVYFPRIEEDSYAQQSISTEPIQKGNESILLVDDEVQLVRVMQQMLERLGYHVTARANSVEALEAFRHQPEEFDLVITDQTMPNMTGAKLAQEIMGIRSDIPVILFTGFSEVISEEKAKAMGIREYIMKPVITRDLAKAIRRVLDE